MTMTTTTLQKPRPRHFQDDLLKTLATLSGRQANTQVPFKDTYEPVCTAMGIDFDSFGKRGSDGKPWVAIWMLGAFRALKGMGLASQSTRGQWEITDDGLIAAEALLPAVTDDEDTHPSVSLGPGNDTSGYHSDPHIRSLAANQTPCFGHYTTRSTTCGGCPLAGACENLVAATVSALAASMAERDEQRKKDAADPIHQIAPAAVAPTPAAVAPTPAAPSGGWDNSDIQQIISYMDATCYRCGKPVPKDDECYWKAPDPNSTETGLFHLGCK
jgi:hypothetical protein